MNWQARQAMGLFIDKVSGPMFTYLMRTRIGPTGAQVERELAQKYGEIAEHMAGSAGEVIKPEAKPIKVSYCAECLERHFSKAHGLLEEAERFSLKEGKLTPDAAQKVRKAVEELVTSEDDLDSTQALPEVRNKLNEIKDKMRDIRKTAWGRNLSFEGASLNALREMKTGVDNLLNRIYDVMAEARYEGEQEVATTTPLESLELKKLSAAEKAHVLHEVYETSKHLGESLEAFEKEDFGRVNESLEKAINSTSCASCQLMLTRSGIDVTYVATLKEIEAEDYEERKRKAIENIKFIRDDYLQIASETEGT